MKSLLFAALLTVAVSMALGQAHAFESTVVVTPSHEPLDNLLMITGSIVGTVVLFMGVRHMYRKTYYSQKPMMP